MADRLQLPLIEPEVEPDDLVRARAESRTRVVAGMLMVLMVLVGARGAQLCLAPLDRTVRAAGVQRWDQVTLRARRVCGLGCVGGGWWMVWRLMMVRRCSGSSPDC